MLHATLFKNIACLAGITAQGTMKKAGTEMSVFESINNAFLWVKNGKIEAFGAMEDCPSELPAGTDIIDASGKFLLPAFADSHTHIVFARTREEEFVMRIGGKSYEEIAAAGGGILNSAARLRLMSEDELYAGALQRLNEVIAQGTGAIEIKSGYGLTTADELKMLRVIKRLKAVAPIPVKATFLGAHAFPAEFKQNRQGYINLLINEMLPAVAAENLADYIDVFCDHGFFTTEETSQILEAAAHYKLKAKIHGNELGYSGGVQTAVKHGALSVDHLEYTGDEEIDALLHSDTMPVALPGCSFFLGIPYAPVRKMIDAGLPVCLASDYNPGSTPNGRMSFVVSLACIQMKLSPEEAFNACTLNGAYAMELSHEFGSIRKGNVANLILTKPMQNLALIPYSFGKDLIESVYINGKLFEPLPV